MPGFTYTVQQTSPGVFTNCCCGCARAPLIINPWVGESADHGRPIHAFGGRMRFTDTAGTTYTNYSAAATANAALSPATGTDAARYSTQFVTYYNLNNPVSDRFPGGANYANNTKIMTYKMAYEFPSVFDSTVTGGGVYCSQLQSNGAVPSDGKTYYLADAESGYVAHYVVKLEPSGYTSAQYATLIAHCTNYSPIPPITGYFPQAFGSYIIPLNAERLPSIPGPTWSYATGTAKQLCTVIYASNVLYQQALGPVLLPADPNYNNAAFWQTAYNTAVANGTLRPGGYFTSGINSPVVVTEWAEQNCEIMRAPLVINPWVGDATNNGRPIHAFGGRMTYTDEFSNSNTNYAAAVAANTASSPATGQSAGRYSSTYVMFNNTVNGLPNQFPGGATYANNTRTMIIRHAYEFPTVIDPRFVTSYPDFALWCGPMHIIGATVDDGQLYLTHDVQLGQAYVVKLVSNGVSTAQYVFVNNCTNYPYSAATGGPPQAIGSFLTTIYSERAPSIPGPTWHYVTGTAKQLCGFYYNANTVLYQQALGPVLLPADPNYNNTTFWQAAYDTAVAAGTLQAGVITRGSNATVSEWAEK